MAELLQELVTAGTALGYEGEELRKFVSTQQETMRADCSAARDEARRQSEIEYKIREHESRSSVSVKCVSMS